MMTYEWTAIGGLSVALVTLGFLHWRLRSSWIGLFESAEVWKNTALDRGLDIALKEDAHGATREALRAFQVSVQQEGAKAVENQRLATDLLVLSAAHEAHTDATKTVLLEHIDGPALLRAINKEVANLVDT